ncbi:putative thaumatin-like protein [Lyophyllum shimeji]|uniref:Thaumatin-like protein n=1 Tax=Lyophyllum shimeji TaxID=47721 RepID=A0A9P3PRC4_LYOSH|nr:putative thaumatin-like protein [Lyophyllum shimeji]
MLVVSGYHAAWRRGAFGELVLCTIGAMLLSHNIRIQKKNGSSLLPRDDQAFLVARPWPHEEAKRAKSTAHEESKPSAYHELNGMWLRRNLPFLDLYFSRRKQSDSSPRPNSVPPKNYKRHSPLAAPPPVQLPPFLPVHTSPMFKLSVVAALSLLSGVSARTLTVTNNCAFTIWPAHFTDLNVAPNKPDHPTGWEAPPHTSVSFTVPDNWKAARVWGRRNCDFSSNPGPNSCLTGGCNGGLLCDPHTGTGVPPATLAEFTFQGDGFKDFYDVSNVDGANLPVRITNNKGCPIPDCPVDLGPNCPAPIKGPFDSSGFPVGCKSACLANLDGNQADSANCCSGSHNTPATCPSSGVQFYSYFKSNCPNAYAYAYDEASMSSLFTCDSNLNADYTVTFCP